MNAHTPTAIFLEDGTICDPATGEIRSLDQAPRAVLTGPQIAAKFVADMFGTTTEHDVHICRYPNDKGGDLPFRKTNTREGAAIASFACFYTSSPGFCIGYDLVCVHFRPHRRNGGQMVS
jgi:hypothetical protein